MFDSNLSRKIPRYLFQCGLATLAMVVILAVEDVFLRAAFVVAVASSAFVVFVVPHRVASTPRKVIGGHLMGVVAGSLFAALLMVPAVGAAAQQSQLLFDVIAALAVGSGIFLMVTTNTEHAPAAGTALGLVIHGWSWSAVAVVLVGALVLSILRAALLPKLSDLL